KSRDSGAKALYNDGSKTDEGTGCAYCIHENYGIIASRQGAFGSLASLGYSPISLLDKTALPGMLSDGVILLHDNTHNDSKTQELLQKFKWGVWSHPPYRADLSPNMGNLPNFYLEQGSVQTVLSGSMDRT
ncbi:hypothetical protein AVEN_271923-2-1, partial [Araneus ventricosus]